MSDVTRLLDAVDRGEPQAAEELLPLVYEELRRLAAHKMASESPGQTLQPTALVHEVWLRISAQSQQHFPSRDKFYSAAAEMMRRILVDRARRKKAVKHGGNLERTAVEEDELYQPGDDLLLNVHAALEELELEDPEKADVVRLRFFVGLTAEETAALMSVNEKTVRRHWSFAKAWLYKRLRQL